MDTRSSKTASESRRKDEMAAKSQTERKHPDEWAET